MMDGYYAIGEAARLTGLSVKTIRYYANEGVVSPAIVSDNGYRLYSPSDLWRLGLVRLLRQLEFGLPEIRKIRNRSLDVPEIVLWQREVLDLQIQRLLRVRALLERIPAGVWGVESLVYLHTILEAMQMSKEQKEEWLAEHWSSAMIPEDAPESWRQSFLGQIKDSLPDDLTVEQAHAWGELQTVLADAGSAVHAAGRVDPVLWRPSGPRDRSERGGNRSGRSASPGNCRGLDRPVREGSPHDRNFRFRTTVLPVRRADGHRTQQTAVEHHAAAESRETATRLSGSTAHARRTAPQIVLCTA
ncbi:MAG: MerR family transcriptional regulator [Bacilli bacterium]